MILHLCVPYLQRIVDLGILPPEQDVQLFVDSEYDQLGDRNITQINSLI